MRPIVLLMWFCGGLLLFCLLLTSASAASHTKKLHLYKPYRLYNDNTSLRQPASVMGRSADSASPAVGTGRGLMAKWMMFKNMFQQPQSNVIIITQPTPTTTPTTTTTTGTTTPTTTMPQRSANADVGERSDGDRRLAPAADDAAEQRDQENVPVLMGNRGLDNKLAMSGASASVEETPPKRKRKRGRPINARLYGEKRKKHHSKRRHSNVTKRKRNRQRNNHNNNNNNNSVNINDILNGISPNDDPSVGGDVDNARIQKIINALQRKQQQQQQ